MRKKIWEFVLTEAERQEIRIPEGSQVISVQEQFGQLVLWAVVDTEAEPESRVIVVFFTGQSMEGVLAIRHLGTVLRSTGLVVHVFEEAEP